METFPECKICADCCDPKSNPAYLANCGHIFCLNCIKDEIEHSAFKCPFDKIASLNFKKAPGFKTQLDLSAMIKRPEPPVDSACKSAGQTPLKHVKLGFEEEFTTSIASTLVPSDDKNGEEIFINDLFKETFMPIKPLIEAEKQISLKDDPEMHMLPAKNRDYHNLIAMPYEPYDYQIEIVNKMIEGLEHDKRVIAIESPMGTGKTHMILTAVYAHLLKNQAKNKVFYFTRTISQMNHVLREVKSAPYFSQSTMMISKKKLCRIEKIASEKDSITVSALCRRLRQSKNCRYYSNNIEKPPQLNPVLDLEELYRLKNSDYCSYFLSKEYFKDKTNVVALSYFYLLNSFLLNDAMIKGNIIVIDEAHNLIHLLEKFFSFSFNAEKIAKSRKQLVEWIESAGLNTHKSSFLLPFLGTMDSMLRQIEMLGFSMKDKILKGSVLVTILGLNVPENNCEKLLDFFKAYDENMDAQAGPSDPDNLRFFESAERPGLNLLKTLVKKYQRVYKLFEAGHDFDRYFVLKVVDGKLKISCLNGCLGFKYILQKEPKAIILSSGTLSPFDYYEAAFETTFDLKLQPSPELMKRYFQGKFNTYLVSHLYHFNNHQSIQLTFESYQQNPGLYNNVLSFVLEISKELQKGGVLVFLPSYAVLFKYKQVFNTFFKDEEKAFGKVLFESQVLPFDVQFREYSDSCCRGPSLFFLVINGKFSEGVDFKDDLARLAFIVGIPYENINSNEIQTKKETNSSSSFFKWYIKNSIIKVNQAAGRIKRTKNDWGAVFLVDSRFTQKTYNSYLSEYIMQYHHFFENYSQMLQHLSDFCSINSFDLDDSDELSELLRP